MYSMPFLPKSNSIFQRHRKSNPKTCWSHKRPKYSKRSWERRTKLEVSPFLISIHSTIVIKSVWYWHNKRHIDQWNRIKKPEINPHIYGQLIFDKWPKIPNGERIVSSINWCWIAMWSHKNELTEKFESKLQWDTTSHLLEWLSLKRQEINIGKDEEKRELLLILYFFKLKYSWFTMLC